MQEFGKKCKNSGRIFLAYFPPCGIMGLKARDRYERNFFDRNIINPIFKDFSEGLQTFLNVYYAHDVKNVLFRSCEHIREYMLPSYMKDKAKYKQLGNLMPEKFNFIRCDIDKLCHKTQQQYSLILLSNIFGFKYIVDVDCNKSANMFLSDVLDIALS